MNKHSEAFEKKLQLKNEFKQSCDEFLSKMLEIDAKAQAERMVARKLEEFQSKMMKSEGLKVKRRERKRREYVTMKSDEERYKHYLEAQARYRQKYRAIRKQRIHDKILEAIGDVAYRELTSNGMTLFITEDGRFFRDNGYQIIGVRYPSGYRHITFAGKRYPASRLVWNTFNGDIPEGMEIDHINTVRDDNRLSNLRLVTHKENCRNARSIENYRRHNKSVDRSYLKKKVYKFSLDGRLLKIYESVGEVSADGYSIFSVRSCCQGRQNQHKGFIWSYDENKFANE